MLHHAFMSTSSSDYGVRFGSCKTYLPTATHIVVAVWEPTHTPCTAPVVRTAVSYGTLAAII